MVISTRFGRRLPLPSTADVKHELRLMAAADAILASGALSPQQSEAMARDLAASNGLSVDRIRMLIDRFALSGPDATRPVPAH